MATRPTLRNGMKGNRGTPTGDAIFLWRNYIGLTPAKDVTVYDFGQMSHDRTKEWQKKHGLSDDGVVGPMSWAKYDALQYGPPAPPASPAAEEAADKIAASQKPPSQAAQVAATNIAAKQPPAPTPAPKAATAPAMTIASMTVPPVVTETAMTVVNAVKDAPLWQKVTGGILGVVLSVGALRRLIR